MLYKGGGFDAHLVSLATNGSGIVEGREFNHKSLIER